MHFRQLWPNKTEINSKEDLFGKVATNNDDAYCSNIRQMGNAPQDKRFEVSDANKETIFQMYKKDGTFASDQYFNVPESIESEKPQIGSTANFHSYTDTINAIKNFITSNASAKTAVEKAILETKSNPKMPISDFTIKGLAYSFVSIPNFIKHADDLKDKLNKLPGIKVDERIEVSDEVKDRLPDEFDVDENNTVEATDDFLAWIIDQEKGSIEAARIIRAKEPAKNEQASREYIRRQELMKSFNAARERAQKVLAVKAEIEEIQKEEITEDIMTKYADIAVPIKQSLTSEEHNAAIEAIKEYRKQRLATLEREFKTDYTDDDLTAIMKTTFKDFVRNKCGVSLVDNKTDVGEAFKLASKLVANLVFQPYIVAQKGSYLRAVLSSTGLINAVFVLMSNDFIQRYQRANLQPNWKNQVIVNGQHGTITMIGTEEQRNALNDDWSRPTAHTGIDDSYENRPVPQLADIQVQWHPAQETEASASSVKLNGTKDIPVIIEKKTITIPQAPPAADRKVVKALRRFGSAVKRKKELEQIESQNPDQAHQRPNVIYLNDD